MMNEKINILVLGSGGREHALAWKLAQSPLAGKVWTAPGNAGIPDSVNINIHDFHKLHTWCGAYNIGLIVVGPEALLAMGIVDYFRDADIKIFGPKKRAAELESSKVMAKDFMSKYGVSTAKYHNIKPPYKTEDLLRAAEKFNGQVVIKYDGLAAGKGVFVCENSGEASAAIELISSRYGSNVSIVFEEKLTGPELSFIGITDGACIQMFQPSQDHKRLLDGDKGPNTGGMGAYTPVKMADRELCDKVDKMIVQPTLRGIQMEGFDYKGFIYFGVLVQNGTPYLLEYNVRMGDPETEVILPSLKTDLAEAILKTLNGSIKDIFLEFYESHFVDVVLASGGYPDEYESGLRITGLDDLPEGALAFCAGVKNGADGLCTAGGRVINVIGQGKDFAAARDNAYKACSRLAFKNMFFRKDIGYKNL